MDNKSWRLSASEQIADHLRQRIRAGKWSGTLPGVLQLAVEFDVSPLTMRSAIRLLEKEGWIQGTGAGKARTVGEPTTQGKPKRRPLRITILPGMHLADEDTHFQKVVMQLQYDFEMAGHFCRIASKSQEDMNHHLGRIERFVDSHPSDAWVVIGPRREVARWFATREVPTICIGGEIRNEDIAGTGLLSEDVLESVFRHFVQLGHRRILLLWPEQWSNLDHASKLVRMLREALAEVGTTLTAYHVPIWKPTPEGLRATLDNSFRITPPTAIITTYGKWMVGVLSYLALRGLRSPEDVSLFSMNEDDWFAWHEPRISCLRGDDSPMIRRIIHWANDLGHGKNDRRLIEFPMQWIQGETIGPADPRISPRKPLTPC